MTNEPTTGYATQARTCDDQHPPIENAPNATGGKDALISMLRQCEESGAFSPSSIDHARYLLGRDLVRAEDVILTMRARVNRCRVCVHGRRPGLSDGYCTARADLPLAYGHLRTLPVDRGAWCEFFQEAQR